MDSWTLYSTIFILPAWSLTLENPIYMDFLLCFIQQECAVHAGLFNICSVHLSMCALCIQAPRYVSHTFIYFRAKEDALLIPLPFTLVLYFC